MSMAKIEAMFAFQESNYYAVIELLQGESSDDYEVISMLGLSYFLIGDFMKSYVLFSHLFDSNRAIYKLPNENRRECNSLITNFYDMLNTFMPTQMNNMRKIRTMSTATITDTVFLNDAVTRYAANAKKYLCGNDMLDIFIGLSFIEMSMFVESNLLSRGISMESYYLKKLCWSEWHWVLLAI